MSELSRPFQVGLVLVLAFAALWFVALRKHGASTPTPAPTPTHAATPAPAPHKSAIPGGLGRAVDKANATKTQGDAAAAATDRQGAAPESQTASPASAATQPAPRAAAPAKTPSATAAAAPGAPVSPSRRIGQVLAQRLAGNDNAAVQSGMVAVGLFGAAILGNEARPAASAAPAARLPAAPRTVRHAAPSVTPAMVRRALGRGHAVALLFYSPLSSDDRAVRAELSQVNRRGGRVAVYGVALNGLARFKDVLRGIQVVQSPTVVVMARG